MQIAFIQYVSKLSGYFKKHNKKKVKCVKRVMKFHLKPIKHNLNIGFRFMIQICLSPR